MTIRKIQSPYSYITKTIIVTIIAMILIGQTIHRSNQQINVTEENNAVQAPNGIQINNELNAIGTIQQDNNFPIHTHSLLLANQAKIGLRSATTNLNNFLGNYEVHGTIHNINKGTPSIDINRIRNADHKVLIKNNIYTYFNQQIIINLESLPTIHSKISGSAIYIITDEEPILSIEQISCTQDTCVSYTQTIQDTETERFTNNVGHTFYRYDINKWILSYQEDNIYIVQGDDEDILDFSSTIELLDATYIARTYASEIFNACNELENIQQASVEQSGNLTILTAEGTNTRTETLGCTIVFDLRNMDGITNVSLF